MTQANASQTGNGAAAAAPASSAAEPSALDAALKEFESANAQPKAIDAFKALEPVVRYAESKMVAEQSAAVDADVSAAVKLVRAEAKLDEKVPDEIVEAHLHRKAAKDPQFAKAWESRTDNRDSWNARLKAEASELRELVQKMPGNAVKTDIEAALAAVHGASHSPSGNADQPSPTQMFQMNDREWANYKDRLRAG